GIFQGGFDHSGFAYFRMAEEIPKGVKTMQAIDKKELELMKIAYLYYIKGHSQEEISELLQKSKMTVSRMTRKAIEEGIVKISVQLPYQVNEELQEKLLRTFGLKDVVVAKNIIGEELSLFLGGVGAYG